VCEPEALPALDVWLGSLESPNPALVAVARLVARSVDAALPAVDPARAAELRRAVGALAAEQAKRVAAPRGKAAAAAGKAGPTRLEQLRAARRARSAG
jgi:hypothetical protein